MQPVSLDSTEEVRRRPVIVKLGSRHSPLAYVPVRIARVDDMP